MNFSFPLAKGHSDATRSVEDIIGHKLTPAALECANPSPSIADQSDVFQIFSDDVLPAGFSKLFQASGSCC